MLRAWRLHEELQVLGDGSSMGNYYFWGVVAPWGAAAVEEGATPWGIAIAGGLAATSVGTTIAS